ncbi:Cell division and transport-associated protein TolR [Desulfocicer vacuolatum DSM 3385]|uniref:Cell division and transport-associated protein TolR n=1 Tax=Desulfocicer vacuolatum DSM 3385 TaxID=1121400 RepID=A0A1W1ZDN2_9BACT|nr:protein TolR [Desulfocicer vacuolatum]SMC46466.1 Cell division and transport-associated protein TolR [Desulfocicer vacuolatum DSM 3385]
MQSGFNRDELVSEINVTPFVDVMLVLLIIFMVAAPMMVQGVDVNLPRTAAVPLEEKIDHLVVSVRQDGQVYLNEQAVGVDYLTRKLELVLTDMGSRDVYLKADKSVPYGRVVDIMARIKKAGVTNLGMVTLPETDDPS